MSKRGSKKLSEQVAFCPIFFMPEDLKPGEDFEILTETICPDISPYYAISNYGRVLNIITGQIMSPSYRPNGYQYYTLRANTKKGSKKYSTGRTILGTFDPRENMDKMVVEYYNEDKTDNYYNKIMDNGSIESSLGWKENFESPKVTKPKENLSDETIIKIRNMREQGYSYLRIAECFKVSSSTVYLVCNDMEQQNQYINIENNCYKVSDEDAINIRKLFSEGFSYKEIIEKFYPTITISTISDIIRGKTHNR